jgi:hypothetical protein
VWTVVSLAQEAQEAALEGESLRIWVAQRMESLLIGPDKQSGFQSQSSEVEMGHLMRASDNLAIVELAYFS